MEARKSDRPNAGIDVPRRFVTVDGRATHYRVAGRGPAVVMLHDSPRSSRLHLDTMRHLSQRFRVFALDTPGYGNSQPLDMAQAEISDFADALGATLARLGLEGAPLYATHTSAKIALDYAARTPRPARLILDGLSIPRAPTSPAFIERYMRPFKVEETGGYLAAEWTRMRDMVRWFPWFDQRPETRIPTELPDAAWVSDYVIDFFSAGPNYAAAYAAAMRYDPMPALRQLACPTLVAARSNDVLFSFLDAVPIGDNPALCVERLSADHTAWLHWLEDAFAMATEGASDFEEEAPQPVDGWRMIDLAHGPIALHRAGPEGLEPLLILSAPTTLHALRWQAALSDRETWVAELPGFGESAPLPAPSLFAFADLLAATLRALGLPRIDLLATGFATPIGAALTARHPELIGRVIFDGCFDLADEQREAFADALSPSFPFDSGGGHIHRIWHMLRDGEANWPWHASAAQTCRSTVPLLESQALHDALVGILKQPLHYGDAARAACTVLAQERYAAVAQPVLLLDHPGDPGYRATARLAEQFANATVAERLYTIEETAPLITKFLTREADLSRNEIAL